MDSNTSYPLVSLPVEQGTLVPVASELVGEDDTAQAGQADQRNAWCQCCCQLALLLWIVLDSLRQLRLDVIELRCQANYWRALHGRAVEREKALTEQVQQLKGEIRELKQRLFGRKSETSSTTKPDVAKTKTKGTPRQRGQQSGGSGHGRRNHDHVPTTHEDCDLPDEQKCCGTCGKPREEIPGTADGDAPIAAVITANAIAAPAPVATNPPCSRRRRPISSFPKAISAFPCGP